MLLVLTAASASYAVPGRAACHNNDTYYAVHALYWTYCVYSSLQYQALRNVHGSKFISSLQHAV